MTNPSFASQLPQQTSSILQYFPILSFPAIKSDKYAIDNELVLHRVVSGIALSVIAMTGLCWACPPVALFVATHNILVPLSLLVSVYALSVFELWKARSAVDHLAAEEYRNLIPSSRATDRICSSPRAFQHLLNRSENLSKRDSEGMSLLGKIGSSWRRSPEVIQMLIDSDIDLLAVNEGEESFFMLAVKAVDSTALSYILKTGKVQAANIREEDQVAIWKHVENAYTIELLCQYGFNINAQDAEGTSALMHWASRGGRRELALSVAALNAKADPRLQNSRNEKASQLATKDSLLQLLLLQAEGGFVGDPIQLPKEKGLMAWLPWRPFVCKDSFSFTLDGNALIKRVSQLGIAAIAIVFFTPSSMIGTVAVILTGIEVVCVPLVITEFWRSEKEAERQAVVEFLANPVPSKQSTTTICRSVAAARLLVEHSSPNARYLDKLDEEGEHLLSKYGVNPEVFKLLAGKGADIFAGTQQSGFFKAVKDSRPDLLAYILDQRLVSVEDMPIKLQLKMWSSVGSQQTAHFLKQYGFNPNVRDEEENTPLMRIARHRVILREDISKIQALLAIGADRSLVNQAGKTAKDLAKSEAVRLLL